MGLNRVAVGVERNGLAGQRTVNVEVEYRDGRRQIFLQILYSRTIAEKLGFGGPSTSEFDRETADGYSRRRRVGDAIIVEDWDQSSQTGGYGSDSGGSGRGSEGEGARGKSADAPGRAVSEAARDKSLDDGPHGKTVSAVAQDPSRKSALEARGRTAEGEGPRGADRK